MCKEMWQWCLLSVSTVLIRNSTDDASEIISENGALLFC